MNPPTTPNFILYYFQVVKNVGTVRPFHHWKSISIFLPRLHVISPPKNGTALERVCRTRSREHPPLSCPATGACLNRKVQHAVLYRTLTRYLVSLEMEMLTLAEFLRVPKSLPVLTSSNFPPPQRVSRGEDVNLERVRSTLTSM